MMTLLLSNLFLQHYWWVIIALLASTLVFLMFVQGGQSMLFSLPSGDLEKTMMINSLGRKWEFTFTTLVTFGGTFFASFPLFYATSFGGAYWVWTVILFIFIIQAVSYEYRSKAGNIFGKNTFDIFLLINGSAGPFLIGVAVGTFFTGSLFSLDEMNRVNWLTSWRGLEALADTRNLALGFSVLFIARVNGLLFMINTIDNKSVRKKALSRLPVNTLIFLAFFLYFIISILVSDGYAYDGDGKITVLPHKYLHNFLEMPLVMIIFLLGVAGVLYGISVSIFRKRIDGIWFTGAGTIMAVFALLIISGFNGTAFYPSKYDPDSSLTIENASSSFFTLKTMMFVSFVIPVIIGYIWYAWKALTTKKITGEEMTRSEEHKY